MPHSEALFADGIHSAADIVASVVVLLVINVSNKPADEEHLMDMVKPKLLYLGLLA